MALAEVSTATTLRAAALPNARAATRAMLPEDPPAVSEPHLRPGTRVEVRRRLDAKWARGFEVVELVGDSYRVRRLSDGEELPIPIELDDIRRERRNKTWWY